MHAWRPGLLLLLLLLHGAPPLRPQATACVCVPLQVAAMKTASQSAGAAGLPEDVLKALKLQPSFMKGHLLELDTALAANQFDEYKSKTTGSVYPGGKVERELEEVCDTADDFINLAFGRAVEQRAGLQ